MHAYMPCMHACMLCMHAYMLCTHACACTPMPGVIGQAGRQAVGRQVGRLARALACAHVRQCTCASRGACTRACVRVHARLHAYRMLCTCSDAASALCHACTSVSRMLARFLQCLPACTLFACFALAVLPCRRARVRAHACAPNIGAYPSLWTCQGGLKHAMHACMHDMHECIYAMRSARAQSC